MPTLDSSTLVEKLQATLSADVLNDVGKETGFCERLRDLHPARLAAALITCLGSQEVNHLADILRALNSMNPLAVAYKPFHNQLKKETFPLFARTVFEGLLSRLCLDVLGPLEGGVLDGFDDIILQDGTSFAVHKQLASVYPGRFTTISPAAVELHTSLSLFSGTPIRVVLTPDSAGERSHLPQPTSLGSKLLLADAGYEDIPYFLDVVEAGGDIICRVKGNTNPWVTAIWDRGQRFTFEPRIKLKELRQHFVDRDVDLDVHWRRKGRTLRARLALIWNPERGAYMALVTSLDRTRAPTPDLIRTLYRLRWQIELLFKEWKSYNNLHAFETRNPAIAEGLIWFSLTVAVLKRFLAHAAERMNEGAEISTQRAAKALRNRLEHLLGALLRRQTLRRILEDILVYLRDNAQRALPRRDRKTGRLREGLRPLWEMAELQGLGSLST